MVAALSGFFGCSLFWLFGAPFNRVRQLLKEGVRRKELQGGNDIGIENVDLALPVHELLRRPVPFPRRRPRL